MSKLLSPRSTTYRLLARTIAATMFLMGAVPVLQHACGQLAGHHHEISCCCAHESETHDRHGQASCDHQAADELPGQLILESENPSDRCCHIATMASDEEGVTVAVKPSVRVLHPAMMGSPVQLQDEAVARNSEPQARRIGSPNRPIHLLNAVFLR